MVIAPATTPLYPREAKAAREFEAAQLSALFQTLVEPLQGDGPLGDGPAGGAFRSLLVDEMAHGTVARGGIGMAAPVYHQLLALQGLADPKGTL
jgi:Rod binding domain-containing protein